MAQSDPEQARYLQDALAIARGTKSGTFTETRRIRALGQLLGEVVDALTRLEDCAAAATADYPKLWADLETDLANLDESGDHDSRRGYAEDAVAVAGQLREIEDSHRRRLLGAVVQAREAIHKTGAWTEAEEQQANLMREREAELGPDLPSREEREADAIASAFVDKEPEGVSLLDEIDRS